MNGESVVENPLPQQNDHAVVSASPPATIDIDRTHRDGYCEISKVDHRTYRTEEINIDLDVENDILVEIFDAESEKNKVKYKVLTLMTDTKRKSTVVRDHEQFLWLHSVFNEDEKYAGFIIPPAPPKQEFEASRVKLEKFGVLELTMTQAELSKIPQFSKMKQEIDHEYLAQFKKTIAMHDVFLQRIAAHPVFRVDQNFKIFLQYKDLSVREKNTKEVVGTFFKRVCQSADKVLLSGQLHKEVDEFFEQERNCILQYNSLIKDASVKSDKVVRLRKTISETYAKLGGNLEEMSKREPDNILARTLARAADATFKLKKVECRSANDEELKLTDTLTYFTRDTQAAKDLLFRRMRCLANYEAANKNLERVRGRKKDIPEAEQKQSEACKKFEDISATAKTELMDLKKRRVKAFKKNLVDLVDLETNHCKAEIQFLEESLNKVVEI